MVALVDHGLRVLGSPICHFDLSLFPSLNVPCIIDVEMKRTELIRCVSGISLAYRNRIRITLGLIRVSPPPSMNEAK